MEHPSLPRFGMDVEESNRIEHYDTVKNQAVMEKDWTRIPERGTYYHVVVEGRVDQAEDSQVTLASDASATDDEYNGKKLEIIRGKGIGQIRIISDYDGRAKLAMVDGAWTILPDTTSEYRIFIHSGAATAGGTKEIDLNGGAPGNVIKAGMKIILFDLDGKWDYLSWDFAEIEPNSQWVNAENLKSGVEHIPTTPAWGSNSAAIASITYQKPVRVIVPASKFLELQ